MDIRQATRLEQVAAARRWLEFGSERRASLAALSRGESPDTEARQRKVAKRTKDLTPTLVEETISARTSGLSRWLGANATERMIAANDFEPGSFLEVGLAVGRAVCMVEVAMPFSGSTFKGTGFLVAPGIVLTNHHVIQDETDAKRTTLSFNYQNDAYGKPRRVKAYSLDPARFFLSSKLFDCTFVAVGDPIDHVLSPEVFGWLPLVGSEGKVEVGEPINVIQHPHGRPKEWVLRENRLLLLPEIARLRDPKVYAHYEADTLQGSSGAPALSRRWEVFALHHSAVPQIDDQGNILDLDGKPYSGSDDARIRWIGNEGIRVSALVRLIESERSRVPREFAAAIDQILSAPRPDYVALAVKNLQVDGNTSTLNERSSMESPMSGKIELFIPLKITVELASPVSHVEVAQLDRQPIERATPVATPVTAQLSKHIKNALTESLQVLESSRTRKYLDEAKERGDVEAYYRDLDLPGLTMSERLSALTELLTDSHMTRPKYQPGKHVYPWVDLHKEGRRLVIKSIYSGAVFDAAEFIEEAFRIESRRESIRSSILSEEGFSTLTADQLDELFEAQAPYNCEHVVPQSWFAKKEPMRGDLHHLFACESKCNSFRGNHAYFDFEDFEALMDFCGRRENKQFEPTSGKGAVARATLYFLVRYPQTIDVALSTMDESRIQTLLAWHRGDPVSTYERHRNQAIFEAQGNRNPFIDHPDWVDLINYTDSL